MTTPRLRLAFDATACLGAPTGVGQFAVEVLSRLAARPDLDVTAFAITWRGRDALADAVPGGMAVARRPMAARPLRALWRRFDLPPVEWWTGAVDVVHGPNFVVPPTRRAAEVVTVHDLTPVRFPELCTADTLQYPALVARAVHRGAWVHTPSQFVADEVRRSFDIAPERVVAIPNGVSPLPPEGPTTDAATGRARAGADRYVLALGTVEPRKDLPALVAAFDLVATAHPDLRLVVAGPDGWGVDAFDAAVAACRARDRVVRLGWVGPGDRAALLRGASALGFPSRYEGFGLPTLEAMAAGTPVVCTDAGALPEVVGDAAEIVPAELLATDRAAGIEALAEALRRVLDDEVHRASLVARGAERAGAFSWDTTAEALAVLYHRVG